MEEPEDKRLQVLRRKFIVGIPLSGIVGYGIGRSVSTHFGFGKWAGRSMKFGLGFLGFPLLASFLIVQFNKSEIFRIGTSMMREMDELRQREEGPFTDPTFREKWDARKIVSPTSRGAELSKEFESTVDFNGIVENSLGKRTS